MDRLKLLAFYLGAVCLSSCIKSTTVDLVVHNGTIYSCDVDFSVYEAMAIQNGKIIELGPEHQIRNKYSGKKIIDLKKKTIIPTFFDSHSYLLAKALKSNAFNFNDFKKSQLDSSQINYIFNVPDSILKTNPYYGVKYVLRNSSGNKIALDSITFNLIFGSSINGGITLSNADSVAAVSAYLEKGKSENIVLKKLATTLFQNGYSGMSSFGVSSQVAEKIIKSNNNPFYHQLILAGNDSNFKWLTKVGKHDSENLKLIGLSYFIDGGFKDQAALLFDEYLETDNYGKLFANSFVLTKLPKLFKNLGFQLIFHTYGDSSFAIATKSMGRALKTVNDNRWRVEHNQLVNKKDFKNLKKYSILPSVQPTQATSDKKITPYLLGPKRSCETYNFSALHSQNQFITSGSLYPLGPLNPFNQFIALVNNKECNHPLNRKEALKSMTIYSATAAFFDKKTGSLETGKNADFLILNLDPIKSDYMHLKNSKIKQTIVRGKVTYKSVD